MVKRGQINLLLRMTIPQRRVGLIDRRLSGIYPLTIKRTKGIRHRLNRCAFVAAHGNFAMLMAGEPNLSGLIDVLVTRLSAPKMRVKQRCFLVRVLFLHQHIPPLDQRAGVGGDHPRPTWHHASAHCR